MGNSIKTFLKVNAHDILPLIQISINYVTKYDITEQKVGGEFSHTPHQTTLKKCLLATAVYSYIWY